MLLAIAFCATSWLQSKMTFRCAPYATRLWRWIGSNVHPVQDLTSAVRVIGE